MAVFPDRIVLKNSTDTQAAIETAIGVGGANEIAQGEVVVGVEPTSATLYTKAQDGSIVNISGQIDSVNGQTGVVSLGVEDLDDTFDTGDPLGQSVELILRGEGVNNGTTFTDESYNNLTPNFIDACVTSTAQFKYGSSSIYQPQSDYMTYADNTAFHVGSGDFTIETWFYVPTGSNGGFAIGHRGGATSNNGWALLHDYANDNFKFYWSLDGTTQSYIQTSTFIPTVDTWYHVAMVRDGTTGTIYIDGVASATGTISGTINAPSSNFVIGAFRQDSGYFYRDEIYFDEIRLTKAARYTSDFTPAAIELPGTLPADGQLLSWVDSNSTWELINPADLSRELNDLTDVSIPPLGAVNWLFNFEYADGTTSGVSNEGAITYSDFSFNSCDVSTDYAKFGTGSLDATNGFSFFSTNTLTTAEAESLAFGTGDFTVEQWVYWTFVPIGSKQIISRYAQGSTVEPWYIHWNGVNTVFDVRVGSTNHSTSTVSPSVDTWHHVAMARSSGILKVFFDGVEILSAANTDDVISSTTYDLLLGGGLAAGEVLGGYMDGFRLIKGQAIYTTAFTPPTSAPNTTISRIGDGQVLTWSDLYDEWRAIDVTANSLASLANINDVDLSTPATDGQVIAYNNTSGNWEPVNQSGGSTTLGGLTDVDLSTPATDGQVIAYNSTSGNWEPVDQSGGSGGGGSSTIVAAFAFGYIDSTSAGTGTEVSWGTYDAVTGNITVTFDTTQSDTSYIVFTDCETADDIGASVSSKTTSGFTLSLYDFSTGNPSSPAVHPLTFQVFTSSGTQQVNGGTGNGTYLTETQVASGGTADFVGLGFSGILQKVTSDLAAWIVLYSSAAERTADASRAYNTDPTPGSGVLFEAYVTASGTVVATPGTTYFNNDTTATEAVYAAVRNQAGAAVNASVTFSAYGFASAIDGGSY